VFYNKIPFVIAREIQYHCYMRIVLNGYLNQVIVNVIGILFVNMFTQPHPLYNLIKT